MKYTILIFYFIIENSYFGWNITAQSDAEIISDLLFCILFAILYNGDIK